jgi:hypothetical protein
MCNVDLGHLVVTDQESGNRPHPLANIRRTRRPLVIIQSSSNLHRQLDVGYYSLEGRTHCTQCRVLKKFRRPLTTAHRRKLNRETSPNCLAFQIARTTISPNNPGEEFETLDREILVVSADVRP